MQEHKKMLKNFLAFLAGDFSSKVLSFIMVPFYTGILSTAQYGEIDLITSTVNLVTPLITLNCADSVFRFIMSKSEDKETVFTTGISIAIIGLLSFLLVLPFFHNYVTTYSAFLYLLTMVMIFHHIVTNYAKAIGKIKTVSLLGFINTLLFITFNIISLKFLGWGIVGYLLSSIISSMFVTIVLLFNIKAWRLFKLRKLSKTTFISMAKYSLPLIPTNLCWWVVMLSDRYMISWMMGANYTGLYAVANKVPTILQAILTIFMQAWQISSTNLYEKDEKQTAAYFESTLKYSQAFIFIFSSLLIISTQLIMFIIAKNDFYSGWICAPFLVLCITFSFINGIITSIYTIYKKNMPQFYTIFFSAIINIVLNYVLILYMGVIGATISSCISYALILYSRLKNTEKLLQFNRNYRLLITNSLLIILQATLYIYIPDFTIKYATQAVILCLLIFNNKFIISQLKRRFLNAA